MALIQSIILYGFGFTQALTELDDTNM